MSSLRPESHVAHQSRRDKLRVQQLEYFPNNLEQLSAHQDLLQVRNVRNANMLYEAAFYSPEMVNFPTSLNSLTAHRDSECREYASFSNSSDPTPANVGSQQGCDWMVNYASDSVVDEGKPNSFCGSGINDVSSYQHYVKPKYKGLEDVEHSINNPIGEISSNENQKLLGGMHLPSSLPIYHNTLQDVVKSASMRTHGSEMASPVHQNIKEAARGIWAGGGNELVLLPNFGNQSNLLHFDNAESWKDRSGHNFPQWSGELGFLPNRCDEESRPFWTDLNSQGLSLSLSSNPQSELPITQFGKGNGSDDKLQSRAGESEDHQYSKSVKSGNLCPTPKSSIITITEESGNSLKETVGIFPNIGYKNVGPLGPFTGYATILKKSRFLNPAKMLLDELCSLTGPKFAKACDMSEKVSREAGASTSADAVNAIENEVIVKGNNSGGSSSTFYCSNEKSGDGGFRSSCDSFQPEYQQKKAKLLYMHDEVSRRYKQYHQQMQMVVSSFESVAGLSSATPYISLALKSVSRHFKCIRNAISDQLKYIRKVLGEDLSVPTPGASGTKGDTNMTRYMDKCFPTNKSGGDDVGFLEPQHVWRPQRGLPERSVALLRAWLFDHFLHPYPTDTDKHMLATQTGLSRNQVSNWFINARVRVWKPMVEEIHMLETKGLADTNQNSSKKDGSSAIECISQPRVDQPPYRFGMQETPDKQLECLEMGSLVCTGNGEGLHSENPWNQEKRPKLECQITPNMDRSLIGFLPYQRGGLDIGGLGSVSLTLGLRHGVESAQHQQQQLQQEAAFWRPYDS